MNLEERIRRRQRADDGTTLVREWEPLSPVAHVEEPTNRAMIIEQVLDHFDPIFVGQTPANLYVYGPSGTGKSAVITALFRQLDRFPITTRPVIYTSTRVEEESSPVVVYLDAREITSEFDWYHSLLDELVTDAVPERGVGTDRLETRLRELLESRDTQFVVAIDHYDEPEFEVDEFIHRLDTLPDNLCWIAVGRTDPSTATVTDWTAATIEFEPYQPQVLIDMLMARASMGLTENVLDHDQAREIAVQSDGNAHDALTALYLATSRAVAQDRSRITQEDICTAFDDVPDAGVSLSRVLSLPGNRQAVLRELVDVPPTERSSVTAATEAIEESLSLSAGTIKRFIYELAEADVLNRVEAMENPSQGRKPSRVEYRFPPTAFRKLYDRRQ
jgi:Cdc6-like AAA superfamily ATPase